MIEFYLLNYRINEIIMLSCIILGSGRCIPECCRLFCLMILLHLLWNSTIELFHSIFFLLYSEMILLGVNLILLKKLITGIF
jgi:hypothetical protein